MVSEGKREWRAARDHGGPPARGPSGNGKHSGIRGGAKQHHEATNTTMRTTARVHEVEVLGTNSPYSLLV
jgi:hypothetical protein